MKKANKSGKFLRLSYGILSSRAGVRQRYNVDSIKGSMILKDEEVEARLDSPKNLLNQLKNPTIVKPIPTGGNKAGTKAIPPLVRDMIAGFKNENQSDVAEVFEVTQATVSGARRGLIGNRLNEEAAVNKGAEDRTEDAHSLALDCLMETLTALGPKVKDPNLKAKDLSRIASDMSKIVGSVRGEQDKSGKNNTQVIILAPQQKKLKDFDFIEA